MSSSRETTSEEFDKAALHRLLKHLLALQAASGRDIDSVADISSERFYRDYVMQNRPVMLPGLVGGWPAIARWTFDGLANRLGGMSVEVSASREGQPDYERSYARHRATIPFRQLLALCDTETESNNVYLVARSDFFASAESAVLLADIDAPARFLSGSSRGRDARLWLGPRGTITPLHRDGVNVLLCQVRGSKRVLLMPALAAPWLAGDHVSHSRFDPARPDFDAFPTMRAMPILEARLSPGDAIFMPAGWWHKVIALSASISVSYTSFRLPKLPPI
jgi:Cupin-like domain